MYQYFLYQCLTFKFNFKILNKTQTEYLSDEEFRIGCKMQRVLNVDRTTPNMITLYCTKYKCTMYNKLLNASNKLFQLGNIAEEWIENSVI